MPRPINPYSRYANDPVSLTPEDHRIHREHPLDDFLGWEVLMDHIPLSQNQAILFEILTLRHIFEDR